MLPTNWCNKNSNEKKNLGVTFAFLELKPTKDMKNKNTNWMFKTKRGSFEKTRTKEVKVNVDSSIY